MKMKTLLIGSATFAVAGALFAGVSYAATQDQTPVESSPTPAVIESTPTPTPTPTITTTPEPTVTAEPTPAPTETTAPAPAPKQQQAPQVPVSTAQPSIPVVISCPDYIAATPQPTDRHGAAPGWLAGYTNVPADQIANPPSIWYDPANTCNSFGF